MILRPRVSHLLNSYLKQYPPEYEDRFNNEVFAYTNLSEFTPKLLAVGDDHLLIEGLTPLISLHPKDTVQIRDDVRDLLQRLHDSGYWHRDASVIIDFEHLIERSNDQVSYDLFGAYAAGAQPTWGEDPDGVWWGSESTPWSPHMWWNPYSSDTIKTC